MPHPRIVLITGVSRGLGCAMAHKFAALGHVVVGCGRSKSAIASLRKELGPPHRFSVIDVSFGDAAGQYPGADAWAGIAVPFLLALKASDNGKPLTVPAG